MGCCFTCYRVLQARLCCALDSKAKARLRFRGVTWLDSYRLEPRRPEQTWRKAGIVGAVGGPGAERSTELRARRRPGAVDAASED
jgi:hypothetical protein